MSIDRNTKGNRWEAPETAGAYALLPGSWTARLYPGCTLVLMVATAVLGLVAFIAAMLRSQTFFPLLAVMAVVGFLAVAFWKGWILVALAPADARRLMVASLAKSRRLRRVSQRLDTRQQVSVADVVSGASPRVQAEEDLFRLVEADPGLRKIMAQHGADRDTLSKAYHELLAGGAGQWIQGHFVAASALVFGTTLDYVLGNIADANGSEPEIDRSMRVSRRMITYFANAEVGFVSDD